MLSCTVIINESLMCVQVDNTSVVDGAFDTQAARLSRAHRVCERSLVTHRPRDIIPDNFFHLYSNDEYKFLYCEIPKVACTNWKRIMLILTGRMNTSDPMSLPSDEVHDNLQHTYLRKLSTYSTDEIRTRLKTYYKFIFVRNPLERILSAYTNKFTLRYNTYFHLHYGRKIIKRYRKDPSQASLEAGNDVTFQEFVRYLLDPATTKKEEFNGHWRQYYQLCLPCVVNYDFIGKFDTLNSDISSVLSHLNVDRMLHFPDRPHSGKRPPTADILRSRFANISSEDVHKLWELYSVDFAMFGYQYPDLEEPHY